MSGELASVGRRSRLAGRNRAELPMFRLDGERLLAINILKMREFPPCSKLSKIPQSHKLARGIASVRGRTISGMILSMVDRVGVNRLVARFDPDILAGAVLVVIREMS